MYHMNNKCYKRYTLKKAIKKSQAREVGRKNLEGAGETAKAGLNHQSRSESTSRAPNRRQSPLSRYKKTCEMP